MLNQWLKKCWFFLFRFFFSKIKMKFYFSSSFFFFRKNLICDICPFQQLPSSDVTSSYFDLKVDSSDCQPKVQRISWNLFWNLFWKWNDSFPRIYFHSIRNWNENEMRNILYTCSIFCVTLVADLHFFFSLSHFISAFGSTCEQCYEISFSTHVKNISLVLTN